MKRDIDLIRRLLQLVECQGTRGILTSAMFLEMSEAYVRHHLRLLAEAGLAKYVENVAGRSMLRLTSEGHELVELSRDDTRWDRAKALVAKRTGGVSLLALKGILAKWALDELSDCEPWSIGDETVFNRAFRGVTPTQNGVRYARIPAEEFSQPEARTHYFSIDTDDPQVGSRWNGYAEDLLPIYLL